MYKWLLLFMLTTPVFGTPLQHLTKLGQGEMDYLFWTLYEAELYAHNGRISPTYQNTALKLTYAKSISKQALLEATQDQWEYLGYHLQDINRWLAKLHPIWPNVEPDDELTFFIDENGISRFYMGKTLLGVIGDIQFGQAFMAIWLSKNTSEPELRQALLGD